MAYAVRHVVIRVTYADSHGFECRIMPELSQLVSRGTKHGDTRKPRIASERHGVWTVRKGR